MNSAKILYGVCGIGSGHTFRQLPIVDHLSRKHRIVLFAYGEALKFYSEFAKSRESITVVPVSVPFLAGNLEGIDFTATLRRYSASGQDHLAVNFAAMAKAAELIGKPDLVISDYEPVSAQYAYAYASPVVTIDQQSKYLVGDFPRQLAGQGFANEVAMLRMFFPKAEHRIACSFFKVNPRLPAPIEQVRLHPPIFKDAIKSMKRCPQGKSILIYLSAQQDFVQSGAQVAAACSALRDWNFEIFAADANNVGSVAYSNVRFFTHGDPSFLKKLAACSAIVSTAGHTLLSEAMYLGIPAYVIPLPVYEQQMNARIIDAHGFGCSHADINAEALAAFLNRLPQFADAIAQDQNVLLRGCGKEHIIGTLEPLIERV